MKDHDLVLFESYKILRHFDEATETKLKNRLTKVGCERFGELANMFAKSRHLEGEIRQRLGAIGYEF